MEIKPGHIIYLNWRMFICFFAIIVSVMLVVSGDRTMDSGYDSNGVDMHDFKNLWDIYILPRLQLDLNRKVSQWLEEQQSNRDSLNHDYFSGQSNPDQAEQHSSRFKRIGVAGLENLDIMTKTLDQNRLPMSVSSMNTNRLRMLMSKVGRKRK